jgi:hypothetical protein
MAGGLLNLISNGNDNVILYSNPSKTFFKCAYKQITNFGKQKFRIDNKGTTTLNFDSETTYKFTVPRHGDLLGDTYLVLDLPDIWSGVYVNESDNFIPYNFKWIENIGSHLIKEIIISAGGAILGKYDGEYFYMLSVRDDDHGKNELWNKMTGNIPDLYDPASLMDEKEYPNAVNEGDGLGVEPSIRGRKLYIPLKFWFTHSSKQAFPLIAMQYVELNIQITLNSIKNLYTIRDVEDSTNDYPHIAPDVTNNLHQIRRFLEEPKSITNENKNPEPTNRINAWNPNIHLLSTYYFLSQDERVYFAKNSHSYVIKDVYIKDFENITGSRSINLESLGLVSGYNFRFQRSDTYLRNTWNNFTNFPYGVRPQQLTNSTSLQGVLTSGELNPDNIQDIMIDLGIIFDGKYRENTLDQGVYQYLEPYCSSKGGSRRGYYFYNFGINSDYKEYQPSGAMNTNNFQNITFEFNTIEPPITTRPISEIATDICDGEGNVIGTRKNVYALNEYNFNLKVYEERINMIIFKGGIANLMFAR